MSVESSAGVRSLRMAVRSIGDRHSGSTSVLEHYVGYAAGAGMARTHRPFWSVSFAFVSVTFSSNDLLSSALLKDIPIIADDSANKPKTTNIPVLPGFHVSNAFLQGIRSCRWPGRSQVLRRGRITYFLDGAHTPKSLEVLFSYKPWQNQ